MQPLAKRKQSIQNDNRGRDESEAPWITCSGRVEDEKIKRRKGKEKGRKEGPLFPFYGPIREGKGFLSHAMQEEGGGLAICVQVRDEPISTRLHVSHKVMGWKKKNGRERGERISRKKKWLATRGDRGFLSVKDYQPDLSFYWFSFDVYGSKGNRHGANPN